MGEESPLNTQLASPRRKAATKFLVGTRTPTYPISEPSTKTPIIAIVRVTPPQIKYFKQRRKPCDPAVIHQRHRKGLLYRFDLQSVHPSQRLRYFRLKLAPPEVYAWNVVALGTIVGQGCSGLASGTTHGWSEKVVGT